MDGKKFILTGQDKSALSMVKNTLTSVGHIFIGYSGNPANILRYVRSLQPELVVIEAAGNFSLLKPALEILDEELLTVCILLLDVRDDEVFEFLDTARTVSYITKPVFDEVLLQIADMSLSNYRRIREYEDRIRQLNYEIESRRIIDRAKWILIEQDSVSEGEAYDIIRKKSRENRVTMRVTAEAIILVRGKSR